MRDRSKSAARLPKSELQKKVVLTPELIEGFVETYLVETFEGSYDVPDFHRDIWKLYCAKHAFVAIAAPRGHGKSTAGSYSYTLASTLFGVSDFVLLLSATEELAAVHLRNIRNQLADNPGIAEDFGVKLEKDNANDLWFTTHGRRVIILARGAEQKIRGANIDNKRPSLIVCHEKGTRIEDAGKEMFVEEHPTAQIEKREGLKVRIHGIPKEEVVTPEHRYWAKEITQKKKCRYENGKKVEHWTEYQSTKPDWEEAQHLNSCTWLGLPIDLEVLPPEENIPALHVPEFWWHLGLWWGDGTLGQQGRVAWYVADKDMPTIGEKVKNFWRKQGKHVCVRKQTGCYSLSICCHELYNWLKTWKFGNSIKIAPSWVLKLDPELQADIVRGYVAADGFVDYAGNQVRLTSVCYQGLLQVRKMLARNGIAATIRQGIKACKAQINDREVNCQEKFDLMFRDGASALGYDIQDSERYTLKKVFIEDGFLWSKVKSVEESGVREFVPIQTESHTYLTSFGLSHNCDDMEDDEMVMNDDRRKKFRTWFKNAVLPIGSDHAVFRVLGTILHLDSFLERLLNSRSWLSARFKAHKDFDDFSDILWEERFSEERLRQARQVYIDDEDTNGYCQEYLCYPINEANGYFRKTMFVPMSPDDHLSPKYYYVAVDFAISRTQSADFTAMLVAGVDSDGHLHVVDLYTFKGDGPEIIEQLFIIQKRWKPEFFIFENGQISKSLGGFLRDEVMRRSRSDPENFLSWVAVTPSQNKEVRARSIQKRMQIGGVKFDTEAEWFETLKAEMMAFPRAPHDDQVDAMAYIGMYLDKLIEGPTEMEVADQEWEEEMGEAMAMLGRCESTGY